MEQALRKSLQFQRGEQEETKFLNFMNEKMFEIISQSDAMENQIQSKIKNITQDRFFASRFQSQCDDRLKIRSSQENYLRKSQQETGHLFKKRQSDSNKYKEKYLKKKSQCKKLKSQIDNIKTEKDMLIYNLRSQEKKRKKEKQNKDNQMNQIKTDFEQILSQLNDKLNDYEGKLVELSQDIKQKEYKLQDVCQKNNKLIDENASLEEIIMKYKKDIQNALNINKINEDTLKQQQEQLEKTKTEKKDEIQKLKNEYITQFQKQQKNNEKLQFSFQVQGDKEESSPFQSQNQKRQIQKKIQQNQRSQQQYQQQESRPFNIEKQQNENIFMEEVNQIEKENQDLKQKEQQIKDLLISKIKQK